MPTPQLNVAKSANNANGNTNNNTTAAGDAEEGGGESSEPANDSNRPLKSSVSAANPTGNTLTIPAKSPTSPSNRPRISVEITPATPGRTPVSSARPTISSAHPSSQPSAAPSSARPLSSRPQSPHEAVHNWVKAQSPHVESAREHVNTAPNKSLSKRDSHPTTAATASTTAVASGSASRSRRGSQSSQKSHPDMTMTSMPRQVSAGGGSVSGGEESKGKFSLKKLLSSEPKLSRRNSASSKKSVSSAGGGGGGKSGSRAGSVKGGSSAGESALESKYGVYGKMSVGKGATSIVRLAHRWDRSEEKLYAVKEFRPKRNKESQRDYVKKLTAEFCISSALRHPNVVETVDLMQDSEGKWCEVMEFCPGGDLYNAIRKGGMSPAEVECCFKQILQGVGYLHGQGVAHRDLKPENLFFDARGQIKVGDFGASTVFRLPWEITIHKSSGLCGSEPYIAPEQFAQPNSYDARLVDIWACGIVYYCLHFQELPWSSAQLSDKTYSQYAQQCSTPQLSIAGIPFLKSATSALTTTMNTPAPGTPIRQDSGNTPTVGSLGGNPGTPLAMSPVLGTPLSGVPPALSRAERERENQREQAAHYPATILHLSPRACRPVLRRMLEPKPDLRVNIEDILKHPWIASIEVCTEQSPPKHIHPAAIAAAAQGGIVSDK